MSLVHMEEGAYMYIHIYVYIHIQSPKIPSKPFFLLPWTSMVPGALYLALIAWTSA